MKITIIGYSGGGKTTLAKNIARKFSIPHQQIDRIWFEAGGHTAKSDSEKERVRKIIEERVTKFSKQDSWVSDGFYSKVQGIMAGQADHVVVIELPLLKRLLNHWKRVIQKEARHPEVNMAQDLWHSIEIVKRTFTFKEKLESFKKQYPEKLVVLKSFEEINTFLGKL